MDRKKFYEYISKPWPKKIIRAKGITYFNDDKNMSYMFEQAGSLKDITEAGPWLVSESPDFIKQVREANPDIDRDWDEFYGDKMVKIVFIGKGISKEGNILDIAANLDIINKSGAWFSYNGERLAQGRDNAKQVLKDNPQLLEEVEAKVREKYNEAFVKSMGNEEKSTEDDE